MRRLTGRCNRRIPTQPEHVLLVGSSGGHLSQLLELRGWWQKHKRTWVTFDTEDTRSRLSGEQVVDAYFPTTRNVPNLLRNLVLAVRLTVRLRPDIVVSTGAGVAIPFFMVARVLGVRSAYIEVFDRIETPTLTGRVCYRLCDHFFVQWPHQARMYPRATVIGPLM